MTVTFERDQEMVKMNHQTKYFGQRSFSSKVIIRNFPDTCRHKGT